MTTVLTTIPLIIKELKTQIETKISDIKFAYDPQLSYETGTRMLRAANKYKDMKQGQFPLFLFNRTVLRYHEQLGKRAVHKSIDLSAQVNHTAPEYRTALGEFDFRFAFISPNMSEAEAFEIEYFSKEGIYNLKEVNVSIPGLADTFLYSLSWGELEDTLIESENWYAKTVTGTCKIQGWFIVLRGSADLIQNIYFDVYDYDNETVMEQFQVT